MLYGTTPRILNLENYLIKPSAAEYVRREVAIAEIISGDPSKLVGQTITKSTDSYTTASISSVEAFTRNNKQYFKLEFFIGFDESDTITGTFNVTPSSKSLLCTSERIGNLECSSKRVGSWGHIPLFFIEVVIFY